MGAVRLSARRAAAKSRADRASVLRWPCISAYSGVMKYGAALLLLGMIGCQVYAPPPPPPAGLEPPLSAGSRAYMDTMLALPAMREWIAAAEREGDALPKYDAMYV